MRSIRGFLLAAGAAVAGGAGTWDSHRGHRGSLREMSTYRKHLGHAAATIPPPPPPPPEGESHPSPCSTAPPRRFTEDVVTDDDDGDAPAPLCCWLCFPRSNRSSAVFTFSIVHTLWYVAVAPPQAEDEAAGAGAAGTAQGLVAAAVPAEATGNRLRSLGAAGHACFCRDAFPGCSCRVEETQD